MRSTLSEELDAAPKIPGRVPAVLPSVTDALPKKLEDAVDVLFMNPRIRGKLLPPDSEAAAEAAVDSDASAEFWFPADVAAVPFRSVSFWCAGCGKF